MLDAQFLATAPAVEALPPPAFVEVAFAGRSNVGKSSLINRLVGRRKLVRTSSKPGCTRGLGLFRARIRLDEEGHEGILDFVDLPGYGYAKRSKSERASWGPMIEGFLERRVGLRVVIVIVDIRRGVGEEEEQLLEYLESIDRAALLVATKLDKLPANQQKPALARLRKAHGSVYAFSAETGEGKERLLKKILKMASLLSAEPSA